MKKPIKHKKALIIFGCIIIIILLISPITNIYCTLKFQKSKVININSDFKVINGELYEITPDEEYYLHTFKGKTKKVDLTNNELNTFISEEFNKKILSFLSDKDIELMNNSKSAFYSKDAAYIDEFGNLFVKGLNTYGELGLGNYNQIKEFTKVTNIPSIKKVCCGSSYEDYIVILTENEEILISGNFSEIISQNIFTQINTNLQINDIVTLNDTIIALDKSGKIYELGKEHCDPYFGNNINTQFKRIKKLNKIIEINYSGDKAIALSKNGKVYYWGTNYTSKAYCHNFDKTVKGYYHADKILVGYNYIYMFDGDTIIRAPLK